MPNRLALPLVCSLLLLPVAARAEEGSFNSNGVRIHYTVEGEGEPVLLIHGFAVNQELQWRLPGIVKELAKNHRVIAYDNRGHGKSGKPTDPKKYGIEMVEDAVRLLDHLKIRKAHVVGYSMGAIITGKLLASHPDRLLSATLGGAGVVRKGTEIPRFMDDLAKSLEEGKGMGPLLVALTPQGKPKPSDEEINRISRMLVRGNGKALAAVIRGFKEFAVTDEQLKANKVPTLALIGELDPIKKSVDESKDRMAHLEVVVIPRGDHITAFTSPEFLKALTKFLDEHKANNRR